VRAEDFLQHFKTTGSGLASGKNVVCRGLTSSFSFLLLPFFPGGHDQISLLVFNDSNFSVL
jgi:hypothetical protein